MRAVSPRSGAVARMRPSVGRDSAGDQALVAEHVAHLVELASVGGQHSSDGSSASSGQRRRRAVRTSASRSSSAARNAASSPASTAGSRPLSSALSRRACVVVDVVLALAEDPDDHGRSSSARRLGGWLGGSAAPPVGVAGLDRVGRLAGTELALQPGQLQLDVGLAGHPLQLGGDVVLRGAGRRRRARRRRAARRSRRPGPASAAVLSSARWIARPTSPISSEMPENASPILVCASAAV